MNNINLIRSLHKEGLEPIDWQSIAEEEEPFKREMGPLQNEAVLRYEEYKPEFLKRFSHLYWLRKGEIETTYIVGGGGCKYTRSGRTGRGLPMVLLSVMRSLYNLVDEIKPFSDIEAFCEKKV